MTRAHNTPYKHDSWCDSEKVAQNHLNLDRSDPLSRSHKGSLLVSNIHQGLESHKQKAMRAAVWTFCSHIYGTPLHLLDILVCGHRSLYVALLLEPGADGLEGAISAAPAFVFHTVLHVVVVTVDPLNQVHLKTQIQDASQYPPSKS